MLKRQCGQIDWGFQQVPLSADVNFIGVSLGGARSDRTCIVVLGLNSKTAQFYWSDFYEGIGPKLSASHLENPDQIFIELIHEIAADSKKNQSFIQSIAVDSPLSLPPCFPACLEECNGYEDCAKPSVRWMNEECLRQRAENPKVKYFTPYTQRPVDLHFKYSGIPVEVLPDETLGSNSAPVAARAQYLRKRLSAFQWIEVWPKFSIYSLQNFLGIQLHECLAYRDVEEGLKMRKKIFNQIVIRTGLVIETAESDKCVANVHLLEAFICAWVGILHFMGKTVQHPKHLPLSSGWIEVPQLST